MKVRFVALVLALFGLALVGSSTAQAAPQKYVALGDSYSAASGVLPPDPEAPLQCLRSTRNYPHVLAEKLGAELKDVSCGAAETNDFFEGQYPGVAPQLNALTPDTDLVTMTIGGNDSGVFIGAILSCGAAGLLTLGQGSPCATQYGTSFEDTIRGTTYPSLVQALGAVKEKAPKATVAILGYPWIMPEADGCYPQMPVAKGDVPYLRSLQRTLNDAVRRAAEATGSIYVNMNAVSNDHDACKAMGTRWIEPVLLGSNPVIVHPNALGEAAMADRAFEVLKAEGVEPAPVVAPQTKIARVVIKKRKRKATFRFASSKPESTFRCKLDRRPFRNCKNPKSYSKLKPGKHVFRVAAIDETGKADPTPAIRRFSIPKPKK